MNAFIAQFFASLSKPLRYLVGATIFVSLFSFLFTLLAPAAIGCRLPQILGLSSQGLLSGYIFQPLSYMFLTLPQQGALFQLAFSLLFNGMLLSVIGGALSQEIGAKRFVTLYLATGILSAIASAFLAKAIHSHEILFGPTNLLYACLLLWCMYFPELKLRLFFLLSIKARSAWLMLVSLHATECLSNHLYLPCVHMLVAHIIVYLYAVTAFDLQSPFSITHKWDRWLFKTTRRFTKAKRSEKIVRIKDVGSFRK